jgi:hypothetical protein
MSKIIFKSIGVILLAFVVIALLSMLTDFLLESIGVLPNPQKGLFETWAILLVLFYRGVYTILAGFIVGKLSPVKPLLHAVILGIVGTIITILATSSPSFADKAPLRFSKCSTHHQAVNQNEAFTCPTASMASKGLLHPL